ncbi:MAG: hypothetical protein HY470_00340 [Candidatus Ryanbacteria bacterium]|nr:hypothetical protein [Candidatus Ryanbacteria bacterium]
MSFAVAKVVAVEAYLNRRKEKDMRTFLSIVLAAFAAVVRVPVTVAADCDNVRVQLSAPGAVFVPPRGSAVVRVVAEFDDTCLVGVGASITACRDAFRDLCPLTPGAMTFRLVGLPCTESPCEVSIPLQASALAAGKTFFLSVFAGPAYGDLNDYVVVPTGDTAVTQVNVGRWPFLGRRLARFRR